MSNGNETYTVKSGDTLSGIALQVLGNARRWPDLYRANRDAIESESERRSYAFPRWRRHCYTGPDWIYPGTVLRIPK